MDARNQAKSNMESEENPPVLEQKKKIINAGSSGVVNAPQPLHMRNVTKSKQMTERSMSNPQLLNKHPQDRCSKKTICEPVAAELHRCDGGEVAHRIKGDDDKKKEVGKEVESRRGVGVKHETKRTKRDRRGCRWKWLSD